MGPLTADMKLAPATRRLPAKVGIAERSPHAITTIDLRSRVAPRQIRCADEPRGPWALFGRFRWDHHGWVELLDAKTAEQATPGRSGTERPVRHHRVRTTLVVLLSLVILFVLVSVVLTLEGRARPVTVNQAISRYHSDPSADPGVHPPPGVYLYQGTGTDRLSLPPLSQAEGPTLPGTVEIQADGCWSFRIDYSTNHWQSWTYCARPTGLVETGGLVWQRWMVGPVAETNLSTLRCSLPLLSIPSAPAADKVWPARCTGTSTQIHATQDTVGATRFLGQPILTIAGHKIPSVHIEVQWKLSGAQVGSERDDLWFDAQSGLPLQNRRSIQVRTGTPFGPSTYTENGEFVLRNLTPRT